MTYGSFASMSAHHSAPNAATGQRPTMLGTPSVWLPVMTKTDSSSTSAYAQRSTPRCSASIRAGDRHQLLGVGERLVGRGQVGEEPVPLLALPQRLLAPLPLDALRDRVREGARSARTVSESASAREQRQHADHAPFHRERVAGEGHHPLAARPLRVAHVRVVGDGVGQVRPPARGDPADLVIADTDAAVRPVQVGVEPGAGPELEHPADSSSVQIRAKAASRCRTIASAERCRTSRGVSARQGHRHVGASAASRPRSACLLGPLALGDVAEDQDRPDRGPGLVPDGRGAVVDGPLGPVPGDEDRVVRQPDDRPLPQGAEGGVLDRLAGVLR